MILIGTLIRLSLHLKEVMAPMLHMFQQKLKVLKTSICKDLKDQSNENQKETKWNLCNLDLDLFKIDSFLMLIKLKIVPLKLVTGVKILDSQDLNQIDHFQRCPLEAETFQDLTFLQGTENSI